MTSPAEIAELVKALRAPFASYHETVNYTLMQRAAAALEEVGRDKELLDWAETHPEATMREFTSWWATAGRGCRENHFAFRKIIDAAISAEGK